LSTYSPHVSLSKQSYDSKYEDVELALHDPNMRVDLSRNITRHTPLHTPSRTPSVYTPNNSPRNTAALNSKEALSAGGASRAGSAVFEAGMNSSVVTGTASPTAGAVPIDEEMEYLEELFF
jgi:hypothetical protein